MSKPTMDLVKVAYTSISGKTHLCVKTKNKGGAGHLLEDLLKIPHSSDCLDMVDGELKVFPLLPNGNVKESVAVTMLDKELLKTTPFEESRVYKKLENVLFVPYKRDGDSVCFMDAIHFTKDHEYFEQLKKDYTDIQTEEFSGKVGKYLQSRTKGAGHGTTSRAFYLRSSFMKLLMKQ
jgi:DNA mismatch repair protein MutH